MGKWPVSIKVANDFECKVLNFCKSSEAIVRLFKYDEDYYKSLFEELLNTMSSFGVKITLVQKPDTSETDNQGEMRTTAMVLCFEEVASGQKVHAKINCELSSYGGLEYVSHKIVKPVTKTIEVFE